MSRSAAKQAITLEQFQASMKGIYSTSVCTETIDESPMAYKPMQEIIDSIKDTVRIVDIIKPIYNFKAKTPEKPDWKANKHKLIKED
jgi:RNA-splicing ligase RtcB